MAYLGGAQLAGGKTKVPYSLNWAELLNRQLVVMGGQGATSSFGVWGHLGARKLIFSLNLWENSRWVDVPKMTASYVGCNADELKQSL